MAQKPLRIVIPTNIGDLLKLGNLIYKKHLADGANSPLNSLQDYNWDGIGPNLKKALEHHDKAEALQREMEQEYELRDHLMGDISGIVKASRDVLKGVNARNPKKLGDWGYEVNDTPKQKPGNGNS